jgi:hypothetical protein
MSLAGPARPQAAAQLELAGIRAATGTMRCNRIRAATAATGTRSFNVKTTSATLTLSELPPTKASDGVFRTKSIDIPALLTFLVRGNYGNIWAGCYWLGTRTYSTMMPAWRNRSSTPSGRSNQNFFKSIYVFANVLIHSD